jgi:hypothetical protein
MVAANESPPLNYVAAPDDRPPLRRASLIAIGIGLVAAFFISEFFLWSSPFGQARQTLGAAWFYDQGGWAVVWLAPGNIAMIVLLATQGNRRTAIGSAVLLWVCLEVIFALLVIFAASATRFAAVMHDFKTDLPTITKWVLFLNQGSQSLVGLVAPLLVPANLALLAVYFLPPPADERRARRSSRRLILGTLILCLAIAIVGVISMAAPMVALIQTISSQASGSNHQ